MKLLSAYIPIDRRHALAQGNVLPDRADGAVLFADVSGFTPLTEAIAQELGPQRGAEELTYQLNLVYGTLIEQVHRYGGSVIGFSGDAITCWLGGDDGRRAVACGLAMQEAMHSIATVETPGGTSITLAIKVAIAAGSVRRFLLGDPNVHVIDVLAGQVLKEMAEAEQHAAKDEVVLTAAVAEALGSAVTIAEWREDETSGTRFARVARLLAQVPPSPWPEIALDHVGEEQIRPWLLPAVYERLTSGQSEFLAELRPATALFVKFDGIDYEGDADVRAKLDAYVRWVQRVLGRYEGSLIQLTIGDKGSYLFAAFGAPVAHDDDGVRAVAAALLLRKPPAEFAYIQNCQIGIAQGLMRVGAYGSETQRTYGVLGDKTNLAARLMGIAGPYEIRCDYETFVSAQSQWEFEALPPVRVKGKAGLVRVYQPTGEPLKSRHRPARGTHAFIGRAPELLRVSAALDGVIDGASRILIVEGEPGIGKTRLVEEMVSLMRQHGVSGLIGNAESIEQQTPYRVWRDILSTYFGIDDIVSVSERQAHVYNLAQELAPDQLDRLPLLNDVLNLGFPDTALTSGLDPAQRQQSLTALVLALLQAWTREHPLVLVLEDAHWLDSLSWDLALQVARAMTALGEPLLLTVVARPLPEYSVGHDYLTQLKTLASAETITLSSMSDDDIVTLVTARLGLLPGTLPKQVSGLVVQRSDGNPFFAEEMIFALRDRGLLTIMPDPEATPERPFNCCVINTDFARWGEALPSTLQGLILARIDNLPPDRQLILKVAAVIGRTFGFMPLSFTLGRHAEVVEQTLRSQLDEISRQDFTYVEIPEPDLTYIFKHIVTQEVAYQTLLYAQRRQLHRTVAGWYEHTFGMDNGADGADVTNGSPGDPLAAFYPLLVHHYHYAEDPQRELWYARLTGLQAASQYANAEATRYLTRALELTPRDDTQACFELLLEREQVYRRLGQRDAQQEDVAALIAMAETLDSDERRAVAALRRAQYLIDLGDFAGASEAAQHAISHAKQPGAAKSQAQGYIHWGRSLWQLGDYDGATRRLTQAIEVAQQADEPRLAGQGWLNLGLVAWGQSQLGQAKEHFLHALDILSEIGEREGEGLALNNLGIVSAITRDFAAAKRSFEHALRISQEIGNRRSEGMAYTNLGNIAAMNGDYAGATTNFEKVVLISREIADRYVEASSLGNLAVILDKQGRYAEARRYFDEALAIYRQIGDRRNEGMVLTNMALFFHHTGENIAALDAADQAQAIALELGDRHLEGEALTYAGHALVELERADEARAAYQRAYGLRQEVGVAALALETLAGLARCALREGDQVTARTHVEEILSGMQEGAMEGAEEPLRVYATCLAVLEADRDDRYFALVEEAYRLLKEQAGLLSDVEAQRSFTENVAHHRAIVERYEQLFSHAGGSGEP